MADDARKSLDEADPEVCSRDLEQGFRGVDARVATLRRVGIAHWLKDPMALAIFRWKVALKRSAKIEGYKLAGICYMTLFTHYVVATFLSTFFPNYASDHGISDGVDGLIFAACPAGMALASPFTVSVVSRLGLRGAILFGMLMNALCMMAFGLTPSLAGENVCIQDDTSPGCLSLQSLYFLSYFLSGVFGALADNACLMALQNWSKNSANTTIATASMVCGLGCLIGPTIGGALYDTGEYTPFGKFLFPFVVMSAVPTIMCMGSLTFFPTLDIDLRDEEQKQVSNETPRQESVCSIFTPSFILTIVAYVLNATLVATLDPTLEACLQLGVHTLSGSCSGGWAPHQSSMRAPRW